MEKLIWHTEKRKIDDLIPYEHNPRMMTEKQKSDLEESLKKFNLMSIPVINIDNIIVSGHQRLKILQLLGRGKEVIDVRMPNRELNLEELREANLRENKNIGSWDYDMLANFDEKLYLKSFNTKRLIGRNRMIYKNNIGAKICNYFTNYRYKLRVSEKCSVEEQLKDDIKIEKIIKKIITLGKKVNINLRDFITISYMTAGGQRLGQFMPIVAKSIYEKYCPLNSAKVLDISAGFGGRLVGAMSSKYNYYYIGIDPSTKAVESLEQIRKFLKVEDRVKIIGLPFEDTDNILENDYYDICFTSPPYFKKEIYSDEDTQSCNRYSDIESWKNGFLKKSFEIIWRKLKEGSYMLINIADVKIKNIIYPLEQIAIDAGLGTGYEYNGYKLMEMAKLPGINTKYKNEKIFIFKKAMKINEKK